MFTTSGRGILHTLTISSIIDEAKKRFQKYISGDTSAIHPNLRSAVFRIAVKFGGRSEYDAVRNEWKTSTSIDGKEITLRALGQIQDTETLLPDFLKFLFTNVATQDTHYGASALVSGYRLCS